MSIRARYRNRLAFLARRRGHRRRRSRHRRRPRWIRWIRFQVPFRPTSTNYIVVPHSRASVSFFFFSPPLLPCSRVLATTVSISLIGIVGLFVLSSSLWCFDRGVSRVVRTRWRDFITSVTRVLGTQRSRCRWRNDQRNFNSNAVQKRKKKKKEKEAYLYFLFTPHPFIVFYLRPNSNERTNEWTNENDKIRNPGRNSRVPRDSSVERRG